VDVWSDDVGVVDTATHVSWLALGSNPVGQGFTQLLL